MNIQKIKNEAVKKPLMDRDAKNLADDFYKRLQDAGLGSRDVITITTQLLGIATDAMADESEVKH